MYNPYEIYFVAAGFFISGSVLCLAFHFISKRLFEVETVVITPCNLNPRLLAEYNETVNRR